MIHVPGFRRTTSPTLPRPRLLACDIDGTILDDRGILRPEIRAAVRTIRASGVEVILATGRSPWSGVADLAAELGLGSTHVTMQGALVSAPATGEVVRLRALEPALYLDAIALADEIGLDAIVALVGGHHAERLSEHVSFVPGSGGEAHHFRYVGALDGLADRAPVRVFLPTSPDQNRWVRDAVEARFAGRASITWSDGTGVEILAPQVSKGDAVAWLASVLGIRTEEIAAVGDARNDLELLAMAGRSAAMGGAPADVVAAASIVVPPSSRSGVLSAFAAFFPDLAGAMGRQDAAAAVEAVA